MPRTVPDVLIIGAMKCGTTSLFAQLKQIKGIVPAVVKEPNFFNTANQLHGTWDRGLDWYRALFPLKPGLTYEASTSYTKYPLATGAPLRIYEMNPNAKLIYLVRNPVDRALSHYFYSVLQHQEHRSIEEALFTRNNSFVQIGCYQLQMDQYLSYFPKHNIHIVSASAFWERPRHTTMNIMRFLKAPYGRPSKIRIRHDNSTALNLNRFLSGQSERADDAATDLLKMCKRNVGAKGVSARRMAELIGFRRKERDLLMDRFREDSARFAETFEFSEAKEWELDVVG